MSGPRWERLESLFHSALSLPPEARDVFLARECRGDEPLRSEVERLLSASDRAGAFIQTPAIALSGREVGDRPVAGRRIGAYRVIQEIGRGGMGAVFLAERADGQYEQRVAIKLIKRGMDTDLVLGRFRAERQILASLDHPNIARLLDGGTSDDGLPYFAMEYIEGQPIDVYADGRRLSVADRLQLFLRVCDAVTYAHQHLIVHRDIKPLNILVTADGVPKLLDFGIAKVLDAAPDEPTATVTGLRLLTPEYASPEQVEGRRATTVSDVYSLGVVLYELLTGRSPYRPQSRDPLEVVAAVRTTEPERPSDAVGHVGAISRGARRAGLSTDRADATGAGSTERLRRQLQGDLDTVVLAALRKEPERRYPSVEQLANDIRRHLDGRPVQAQTDSFRYRAGKFIRRNRTGVAAGALLTLALVGGTAATAWQAREARAQAEVARAAQARAEHRFNDLRKLAHAVLFDYHDAIKDLRGSTPVRARLVRDGLGYLDGLAREAQGDPSLQRELAGAYRRMGDVQGGQRGLGDSEGAVSSYTKAMGILDALLRADSSDIRTRRDAASVALALGSLVWERGDLTAGLARAKRARGMLDPLVAARPGDTGLRLDLSAAYDLLGQISLEAGEIPQAVAYHRTDLQQLQSAPAAERRRPDLRRTLSVSYGHLADALVESNDFAAALQAHRQSLAIRSALAAEFPDNADYEELVTSARYYEATVLGRMNRWPEALERFRLNLAQDQRSAFSHARVGEALEHLGRRQEALAHYRVALGVHVEELRADSTNLLKRLAVAEDHASICRALAGLGRAEGPSACATTASFIEGTPVAATHAWPRAFFAAMWSDLGEAYDTLATRHSTSRSDAQQLRLSAWHMYQRSLATWTDLTARGLVSPTDTGRLTAAKRAVARAETAVRSGQ